MEQCNEPGQTEHESERRSCVGSDLNIADCRSLRRGNAVIVFAQRQAEYAQGYRIRARVGRGDEPERHCHRNGRADGHNNGSNFGQEVEPYIDEMLLRLTGSAVVAM